MNRFATIFVSLSFLLAGATSAHAEAMKEFPAGVYKGKYSYTKRDGSPADALMTVRRDKNNPRILQILVQRSDGTGGGLLEMPLKFAADGSCVQGNVVFTDVPAHRGTCIDNKIRLRKDFGPSDYVETEYTWEDESFHYRLKSVNGDAPGNTSLTEAKLPRINE